jgi:hypothetical protein
LAKADTAFQGASVGQPTEFCLALPNGSNAFVEFNGLLGYQAAMQIAEPVVSTLPATTAMNIAKFVRTIVVRTPSMAVRHADRRVR